MVDQTAQDEGHHRRGFGSLILLLVALAFVVFMAFAFGAVYVEPTELGVKTAHFGVPHLVEQGVQKKVLGPGYHFYIPYVEQIESFDASIRKYHMSKHYNGPAEEGGEALIVRTRDESTVTVDVIVLWQIDREFAYAYWQSVGRSKLAEKRIATKVRDSLKLSLGRLGRDEFYSNAKRREELARTVVAELNEVFDRKVMRNQRIVLDDQAEGIQIIDILVSDFHFTEDYERKIRDKAIAEEEATVQKAREKAEAAHALLLETKAKGEAEVGLIREIGEAEARKIRAEAAFILQRDAAKGNLALQLAEGDGRRSLTEAFEGQGGRISTALEYAKTLEGVKLMVLDSSPNDGVNPLDARRMLQLSGVE